jgi:hypothetical protein
VGRSCAPGPTEDGQPASHRLRRPPRRPSTYPCPPGPAQENRRDTDHRHSIRYYLINRPRNRCNSIFQVGVRYLFVPEPMTQVSPFQDNNCTATQPYRAALRKYRPRHAHRPNSMVSLCLRSLPVGGLTALLPTSQTLVWSHNGKDSLSGRAAIIDPSPAGRRMSRFVPRSLTGVVLIALLGGAGHSERLAGLGQHHLDTAA